METIGQRVVVAWKGGWRRRRRRKKAIATIQQFPGTKATPDGMGSIRFITTVSRVVTIEQTAMRKSRNEKRMKECGRGVRNRKDQLDRWAKIKRKKKITACSQATAEKLTFCHQFDASPAHCTCLLALSSFPRKRQTVFVFTWLGTQKAGAQRQSYRYHPCTLPSSPPSCCNRPALVFLSPLLFFSFVTISSSFSPCPSLLQCSPLS